MSLPTIKDLLSEERDFLASWSDLVGTMHKIDAKVSKLHEVVIGDKEFGTEGIIQKLKNIEDDVESLKGFGIIQKLKKIEQDVDTLKGYKNKLVGISIATGVFLGFIFELIKTVFQK